MSAKLFHIDTLLLHFFRLARYLPPPLAQDFYWWLFCRPFTHRRDPRQVEVLNQGKPFFVPSGSDYVLQGWVFGQRGPTVVLCHGWQGSAASWSTLIPMLRSAGFRVVTYNAPGHHKRPRKSSLMDFSQALQDVVETFGADHLVGHSLGAMTVARVAPGVPGLKAVALFSVPNELKVLGENYCRKMEMTAEAAERFMAKLSSRTPHGLGKESVAQYLSGLKCPTLLLHDDGDEVIPSSISRELAAKYDMEAVFTAGLGHRKIIRDPELLARVTEFLSDHTPLLKK